MKPEFLQLAQTYQPKHFISGWLMSEKLDGIRFFWDGGVSRGKRADCVPWANTTKDKKPRYATGLWSRYAKVIAAPTWWLDKLPNFPLDGEGWTKRDDRQNLVSAVKKHTPVDAQWAKVTYKVFDSPEKFLTPRFVNNQHMIKTIPEHAHSWFVEHGGHPGVGLTIHDFGRFSTVPGVLELATQTKLPMMTSELLKAIDDKLKLVVSNGGEGLMFRNPRTPWIPERTYDLLKYKPFDDCEVEVIGFSWGKETDKGSRNLGRMGALHVREGDKTFLVAGFNDSERELLVDGLTAGQMRTAPNDEFQSYPFMEVGIEFAGEINDWDCYTSKMFPIGKTITIKHRGRTKDGIPVEARFWRDYKEIL